MQRISTTFLALAITTLITASSLALLAAAWFMVTYLLKDTTLITLPM